MKYIFDAYNNSLKLLTILSGFPPEFIPAKAGAGMTQNKDMFRRTFLERRYTMKGKQIALFVTVMMFILCSASDAMKLDPNSIEDITTNPLQQVYGWSGTFGVFYPNPMAAWIDNRNADVAVVYGVRLDDPSYEEFLIDPEAPGCYQIATSGTQCIYPIEVSYTEQYVRIADVSDPDNPRRWDYAADWPRLVDIWGSVAVYSGNDPNTWVETIYALDISDPNDIEQYVIRTLPSGENVNSLAIDGNTVVWCVSYSESGPYVQIADITDLNNPVITTKFLPDPINFWNLDISGQWLTAYGQSLRSFQIFAVHNYTDVDHWKILTLWEEGIGGEYYVSGPRVNGPVAAWVTTTRMPSLQGQSGLQSTEWRILHSSYLMGNGEFSLSILRSGESEISAAEVPASGVVWSEYTTEMNLLQGSLLLECGDWGYEYGDLNRDCKVDLSDFAIFAETWLACTTPGDPDCEFGHSGRGS
jgi:hypothetical protein